MKRLLITISAMLASVTVYAADLPGALDSSSTTRIMGMVAVGHGSTGDKGQPEPASGSA